MCGGTHTSHTLAFLNEITKVAEKKLESIVNIEIQCQHCDRKLLHAHMKEVVTCDKCNTDFASESAFKLHKTMYHKYDEVNSKLDEAIEEKLEQKLAENESLAPPTETESI